MNRSRPVNFKRLKNFAVIALRQGSVLREVLLSEEDEVPADAFLHRLPLWLQLLTLDIRGPFAQGSTSNTSSTSRENHRIRFLAKERESRLNVSGAGEH